MSPEMIAGQGYDTSTDVWSFAAMAYLMIFGDFPYMPKQVSSPAMKEAILKGTPEPTFGKKKSSKDAEVCFKHPAADFVKALLIREQDKRLTVTEALELEFLAPEAEAQPEEEEQVARITSLKKARKLTKELKAPINPIAQRGMDELLVKLQDHTGGSRFMFFSEGNDAQEDASSRDSENAEGRILKRRSSIRHSTHSGVVSEKTGSVFSKEPCKEPTDTVSTFEGDSSEGSGGSPKDGKQDNKQDNKPKQAKSGSATLQNIPHRGDDGRVTGRL
mmetsp:Transcript_72568/g.164706  ORF Transcript_72568/g.164706 Transcript_72568/m.164706 type:complete len:275 (+) Transcript_72568:2-826(+)